MPTPRGGGSKSLPVTNSGRVQSATPNISNTPKSMDETNSNISYEVSVTKKIGDFEYIKLTAGVTVPSNISDAELAEIDKKMVVVRDKVVARLEDDFKSINL